MVKKSVLSSEVIINCSTVKVWKVISSPNNLNHSHPFCKANTFQKWGKVGARDTIKYYNNLVLNRYFIEWREGKGYDLIIAKGNQNLAKVTWEILEIENAQSKFVLVIGMTHCIQDVELSNKKKNINVNQDILVPNATKAGQQVVVQRTYSF